MSKNLDHLSVQPTSVIGVDISPFPQPPSEMFRIAGFKEWWDDMQLVRERDKETLYRLVLTKITNGISGETSSGINKFSVIGRSIINANGIVSNQSSTNNTNNGGGSGGSLAKDEDAKLLAWSGL